MEKKDRKKNLVAVLALAVVLAAIGTLYLLTRPPVRTGSKRIVVEVVNAAGTSKSYEYDTDAEYLRDVLEPAGLISGDDSEYGLFIKTVDGYTADGAKQEWWCITQSGGRLNTGVDTTPVADGDHFEITLTVGY